MNMRKEIIELQKLMKKQQIDLYYVLSEDDHNSEYVAPYYQCREYLSGFTGSAGSLLVTQTEAFLWTDGRYFLQAEQELTNTGITLMRMGIEGVPTVAQWIWQHGQDGMTLGYDGRTMNAALEEQLLEEIAKHINIVVKPDLDLAGAVWEQTGMRPAIAFHPVVEWPLCYAGQSAEAKCRKLRDYLKEQQIPTYVITELSEIAWLLNLRGSDVSCNPVFLSYLIVTEEEFMLYASREQFSGEVVTQLSRIGVKVCEYNCFYTDLESVSGLVFADRRSVNANVYHKVLESGGKSVTSPVKLWKAVKNETEIAGEQNAHLKDGAAFVTFLYWLKHLEQDRAGYLMDEAGERVTEISAAARLEKERWKQPLYTGASFEPIVAAAEHGAIVHYSATKESNACLRKDTFVLMDTGGQYLDGTTDITRTVVLGNVTARMKELYTSVLCGNLELMDAVFARGCRGENLDILARMPLWRMGYDFQHGTGHGVGCYLNVHEGPVSIRSHIYEDERNSAVFQPGMIVSDEPGVYLTGEFGIRLENMILCVERGRTAYQDFLGFEALTMVPWDRDAILTENLTEKQKELLNSYHQLVYNSLSNRLEPEVSDWLFEITRPVH